MSRTVRTNAKDGGSARTTLSASENLKTTSNDDAELPWHTHTAAEQAEDPSVGSLKKRFSSKWVRKRGPHDSKEPRSPLGLRLLRTSPEPLVDIVFIHGLRGSSINTWRKNGDPNLFWPQVWLPTEARLRNVSIHSFGYDSDWASTKSSILNVHDFGQSLLEEMRNSPNMKSGPESPIILLGHSMGGLVAKKAFILSKMVPAFKDRIQCMFFLATPHRGSDYATILNNILAVSGVMSSRGYISDLTTGSTSTQLINDDFEKLAGDLSIFSFYETLRMNMGISSYLIVEKHSAVLGFRNERVQYLNANHREICKFESPNDPNYITLRNAIVSATEELLTGVHRAIFQDSKEQMRVLKSYLGIRDRLDDQFSVVDGSCQWIDERNDFQVWKDTTTAGLIETHTEEEDYRNPAVFWVYANPGTGKTFLATYVGAVLRQFQSNCASYFFHYGKKTSLSLGDLLGSLAYQLAATNAIIRETLVAIHDEGSTFDMDDARTIWTIVFKQGIFQAPLQTPQYWVIDAIDECKIYQELFTMIRGVRINFPLRIFITSRKIPDMHKLQRLLEPTASVTSIEIPKDDSTDDIRRYIRSRMDTLSCVSKTEKEDIEKNIIQRSNTSFLWVRMVIDELEKVYSYESRWHILRNIPDGMIPYYERTIKVMSENKLEKHIAKAILSWVTASSRNITTVELCHALKLDIKTQLPEDKTAVEGLCGQLVSVDEDSGLITVVHPTAREFLLSAAAGEFRVLKDLANEKIALACLLLLSGPEMRPLYGSKTAAQKLKESKPQPLLDYAMTQVFEHVYTASSEADELLMALDRFLKTNILTWIEKVAQKGDLHYLIRASKNLKAYLVRRAKYSSPLSSQIRTISGWSVDLSRLVNKFGLALLHQPSSIYSLIPPLCPSGSTIFQQFGKRPDSLAVLGSSENAWNDCVASVSFDDDSIAAAFSCGDNLIAVGMESGHIQLYNPSSCQKEGLVVQKHPVDLVHCTAKRIAASTTRSILLLDLDGNIIWQTRIRFRCILLTSLADHIVAVSQHGHVLKWDMYNGDLVEDLTFAYRSQREDDEDAKRGVKAPSLATVSTDVEMLALAYTMGTVCIWEVGSGQLIGWARDEANRLASVLLFNPNPYVNLLLVMYTDHEMALFETSSGTLALSTEVPGGASPLSASCSPDGRTLATIDTIGNLRIWDFDSLNLLYHILSPAFSFRILNFLPGGSSLVDVTESGMRIWSPASLVRRNIEDDLSTSDAVLPAAVEGQYQTLRTERIMALCAHPSLPVVFAGKHNGGVLAYSSTTGKELALLYEHAHDAFVTLFAVSRANIIVSADVHGVIQVWQLGANLKTLVQSPVLLLQKRSTCRITQLLFSHADEYLLVGTAKSDQVYSMKDVHLIGSLDFDPDTRSSWRWVAGHAHEQDQFVLIYDSLMETFSASSFPFRVKTPRTMLKYDTEKSNKEMAIECAAIQTKTQTLVLSIRQSSGFGSWTTMYLFNLGQILDCNVEAILTPNHIFPPRICKHFIGINDQNDSLVFLHADSWLCSMDPENIATGEYIRHFFVPNEYVSNKNQVLPTSSSDNSIVFSLNGQLAIIKNGMQFRDVKSID